jgi:hypothetical protein
MTLMHVNLTINTETKDIDHKPIDCTSLDKVIESARLLHPDCTSVVLSVSFPFAGLERPDSKFAKHNIDWQAERDRNALPVT